jgi:hypothetical protein
MHIVEMLNRQTVFEDGGEILFLVDNQDEF